MASKHLITGGFNYGVFEDAVADQMRSAADRIRQYTRAAVLELGRELLAAKERVEHGEFQAWVRAECQISIRTAERAMLAAKLIVKNDKLSFLPPDGLLALASPSAPEDTVAEIIEQIEAGETPTAAQIKRQIRTARVQEQPAFAGEQETEQADHDEPVGELTQERAAKPEPEDEHAPERKQVVEAALDRVATMLIEALGGRLAELVLDLEAISTVVLVKTLRERCPELLNNSNCEGSAHKAFSVPGLFDEEEWMCAAPPETGAAEASFPDATEMSTQPGELERTPELVETVDEQQMPAAAEPAESEDAPGEAHADPHAVVEAEPAEAEEAPGEVHAEQQTAAESEPDHAATAPEPSSDDAPQLTMETGLETHKGTAPAAPAAQSCPRFKKCRYAGCAASGRCLAVPIDQAAA